MSSHLDRHVLKALRGKRAQSNLSQLLGYSFNQVYLWETGRRVLYWQDFEKICACLKRPLDEKICTYFSYVEKAPIHIFLKRVLQHHKKRDLARELKVSPSKLSRWLSGYSDPPLSYVFQIWERTQLNFFEFLDDLVGEGKLAAIQPVVLQKRALRDALFHYPFAGAVAPALCTKDYRALKKHQPGVIAKAIGVTEEEEKLALEALLKAGQIEWRKGKYWLNSFHINLAQDKERFRKNCHYWAKRAATFNIQEKSKSAFGYRLFAISKEGFQKIRAAQIDYYNAITEILKSEHGPHDHVVVVNFQSILLDE